MRSRNLRASLIATCCLVGLTAGQASAEVCLRVDESRDTFSPPDRRAALILLTRQFEIEGERVVPDGCPASYTVSHVRLGRTITVTLAGPRGRRDATADSMDDISAVYSQMVRSLLTGRPMGSRTVVDRTNVAKAQTSPNRVGSDALFYARLGYGAMFGGRRYGGPTVGLIGYRRELDGFAVDVSFLNFQGDMSNGYSNGYSYTTVNGPTSSSTFAESHSWIKIEGLRFTDQSASQSPYFGAGLSLTHTSISGAGKSLQGDGLQAEFTVGYEMARASTLRLFVQADAGLPLYKVNGTTYGNRGVVVSTESRYVPSLAVSLGVGWQNHRY